MSQVGRNVILDDPEKGRDKYIVRVKKRDRVEFGFEMSDYLTARPNRHHSKVSTSCVIKRGRVSHISP